MKFMKKLAAFALCAGLASTQASAAVVTFTLDTDNVAGTYQVFVNVTEADSSHNGLNGLASDIVNVTSIIPGPSLRASYLSFTAGTTANVGFTSQLGPNLNGVSPKPQDNGFNLLLNMLPILNVDPGSILPNIGLAEQAYPATTTMDVLDPVSGLPVPHVFNNFFNATFIPKNDILFMSGSFDINGPAPALVGTDASFFNADFTGTQLSGDGKPHSVVVGPRPVSALDLSFTLVADPSGADLNIENPVWGEFVAFDGEPREAGTVSFNNNPELAAYYNVARVVSFDLVDGADVAALVAALNLDIADDTQVEIGEANRNFEAYVGDGGLVEGDMFVKFFDINVNAEGILAFSFGAGNGVEAVAIPEPATMSLFVIGGLALVRRRRLAA